MSRPSRLVIAAGGTGGHMFPAQALADEMLARGWRVSLSTDVRGNAHAGGFHPDVARQVVAAGSFAQGSLLRRLTVPLRLLAGVIAAWRGFRADRPACVAGFGGYPAIPALAAAWMLGLPRLIHEGNAVPGQVNRRFARRVHAVACGVWPTRLPAGTRAVEIGNPVRASVKSAAATPYAPPENGVAVGAAGGAASASSSGPIRLLVFGGSQGAQVFADLVPAAVARLPKKLQARLAITQQVRADAIGNVETAYAATDVPPPVLAPFFADMPQLLAQAQLVIARAGASSLAEIAAIGRPAILIPYPHATDDHQAANAQALVAAGGALMLREEGLTGEALAGHIAPLLTEPGRAARMAASAQGQGRLDAAERLADLVIALSEGERP
ncbi:MAG: undecaprenyldiphospho-muramoylpentapeptide beta-N-acetylglucosaminyltransferase [Pseudomonadota bacterium]